MEVKTDLQVLRSLQLPNGAVSAAPFENYRNIWIRDNAQVAYCLAISGEYQFAIEIIRAILNILHEHRDKIKYRIAEGRPKSIESWKLIHPIYSPEGKELNKEWAWSQNDAVGLLLYVIGEMSEVDFLSSNDKDLLQDLVRYLKAVRYWQEDVGCWEEMEDYDVHASSIQCCASGLQAIEKCGIEVEPDLIRVGQGVIDILGNDHGTKRAIDLAHLMIYFPLNASDSHFVLDRICRTLVREKGVIRYIGDKYEAGLGGSEAEWSLGYYWIALAYAIRGDMEVALHYYNLGEATRLGDGSIAESFADGKPCPHSPLGWPQAYAFCLKEILLKCHLL